MLDGRQGSRNCVITSPNPLVRRTRYTLFWPASGVVVNSAGCRLPVNLVSAWPRVGRSSQRKNVIAASFCNRYLRLKGPSSAGP
jgi:hypothetical protein